MKIKFPKTYCVFDFETTGLDPLKDKIIEIGALRVSATGELMEFSTLIKWPDFPISSKITDITKITQEMIDKEGKSPEEAFKSFYEFVLLDDGKIAPLIGHNILKFDLLFLLQTGMFDQWEGWQIDRFIWNNCIDTAALFKARELGEVDLPWNESMTTFFNRIMEVRAAGLKFNVGACCDKLKISRVGVNQHRALADVLLTNEIYKALCING